MTRIASARRLPDDDKSCGWWEVLPPAAPASRLKGEQRADCAVIGGGFTGLATARRLAEHHPERRIVLLEAHRVGHGSAGRNSGFVGDIFHRDPSVSAEDSHRMKRIAQMGCDQLRDLAEKHDIDCQWSPIGRMHLARADHALKNLDHFIGLLGKFGEPHSPMEAGEVRSVIGTEYYRAGVHIPSTVLLQPAALARGLAAALPENAELYEESPVTEIRREGRFVLQTGEGSVVADRVFLTVNGFAPALGILKRRVFPLMTFASLTRPLTKDEQDMLGGQQEWGFLSEDRMGPTLRRTRDQRILYRTGIRYNGSFKSFAPKLGRIRKIHRQGLDKRFAVLKGVEFEYTWGGIMGMTMNEGQVFGQLKDGLYASVAYNGCGVAMGTAAGSLLADLSAGVDSELLQDAKQVKKPAWLPFAPFLGLGVRAYTTWLYRRAGEER
jgi:glycine/D-amino acid oxidase-like deaminating enzyme